MVRTCICTLLILCSITSNVVQGQDTAINPLKWVAGYPVEGDFFSVDQLQNAYVVARNKLFKIDNTGKFLYSWEENRLGLLMIVDAYVPLKILAYYPQLLTIVYLDKTLSEISRLDLYKLGYEQVTAVCIAWDRNIWIYDNLRRHLVKINDAGQKISESEDLMLILNEVPTPVFMTERNNKLFISDPDKGIFIFDLYGTFEKKLDIKGIQEFQVNGNKLVYWKDNLIHAYDLQSLQYQQASVSEPESVIEIQAIKDFLFLLRSDRLDIYNYSQIKNK